MYYAYVSDVTLPITNLQGLEAEPFMPAPETWRSMLRLPEHLKSHWMISLKKEIQALLAKQTFVQETPFSDDVVTPVTAKFRVKLLSTGMIDKLKTRIAFRGDLFKELVDAPDTWCPIAGFTALKMFLAMAVYYKERIYQLDHVSAFLQSDCIGRKFTILPKEWRDLYPDLSQWFGVPLRLKKSLYGDVTANLAWDDTQNEWLTSPEIGFNRLDSEGSIYIKRTDEGLIAILNAVDDQLYFATNPSLKVWFEQATQTRFDVSLMGQATWYLQSRITQHTDFSITLDQARYAALVVSKYLPVKAVQDITEADKERYDTPVPSTMSFTKEDCSANHSEAMDLQKEFGIDYAGAVGSLIYLINTFIKLQFGVRKLSRFMRLPGRQHYKALRHMLNYISCHRTSGGITFYAEISSAPIYQTLYDVGQAKIAEYPLIAVSDSSFHDCPDTHRSTGGYMIHWQGGVVEGVSVMPPIIAASVGEAEYCTGALAAMAISFHRKVFNEFTGRDADSPLTVALGMDSKAAIDIATSPRETKRTKHIARRYHFLRWCVQTSQLVLFPIPGDRNWSNCLTKPLNGKTLRLEEGNFQVVVPP
jgi:hypothetical protein